MGFSIRIDQTSGIAIVACSGALGPEDARGAAEALWKNPDWPGDSAVWDFREARFDLTTPQIRGIAEFILTNQRDPPPARMAFVAARDVDFGLARMFEAFREDSHTSFRVFRDYADAIAWAGVEERAPTEGPG